jgi:hypothetical protein
MNRKLASIAVAAILVLIGWFVLRLVTASPPPTVQSAPGSAPSAAPSAAPPLAGTPAPATSEGSGAGPANSFIVCPGNPRCPP